MRECEMGRSWGLMVVGANLKGLDGVVDVSLEERWGLHFKHEGL